jgi:hypothetical protein
MHLMRKGAAVLIDLEIPDWHFQHPEQASSVTIIAALELIFETIRHAQDCGVRILIAGHHLKSDWAIHELSCPVTSVAAYRELSNRVNKKDADHVGNQDIQMFETDRMWNKIMRAW